jgi:hypothetical protein
MSLGIRPVSLSSDRAEMIGILNRNFGPDQEDRFDWRHISNPAGESWSWFLYDKNSLATVAMATVFPRTMRLNGKIARGGQVGEFAVDVKYRSLGPAVKLQRCTFEPVERDEIALCYDCPPHDEGMSTFVRLGMAANCEVYRYAIRFRSDEYFAKRLGNGAWIKPIVAGANLMLRLRTKTGGGRNIEVQKHTGRFGEEFSHLDEVACTPASVRSSRAAELLNWRYMQDPIFGTPSSDDIAAKYQILVARRGGELLGFTVFLIQPDGAASLIDLFGVDSEGARLELLDSALDFCRAAGASSFFGFCSEQSELKALFETFGFRRRERSARVVAYTKPGDELSSQIGLGTQWSFGQVEMML